MDLQVQGKVAGLDDAPRQQLAGCSGACRKAKWL
jgi:hypothetical protein